MKTTAKVLKVILTAIQSTWLQPALMTLALVAAILGGSSCKPHH